MTDPRQEPEPLHRPDTASKGARVPSYPCLIRPRNEITGRAQEKHIIQEASFSTPSDLLRPLDTCTRAASPDSRPPLHAYIASEKPISLEMLNFHPSRRRPRRIYLPCRYLASAPHVAPHTSARVRGGWERGALNNSPARSRNPSFRVSYGRLFIFIYFSHKQITNPTFDSLPKFLSELETVSGYPETVGRPSSPETFAAVSIFFFLFFFFFFPLDSPSGMFRTQRFPISTIIPAENIIGPCPTPPPPNILQGYPPLTLEKREIDNATNIEPTGYVSEQKEPPKGKKKKEGKKRTSRSKQVLPPGPKPSPTIAEPRDIQAESELTSFRLEWGGKDGKQK